MTMLNSFFNPKETKITDSDFISHWSQAKKMFGEETISKAQWNLLLRIYGKQLAEQLKKEHRWVIV